jgi:hypothetical protein
VKRLLVLGVVLVASSAFAGPTKHPGGKKEPPPAEVTPPAPPPPPEPAPKPMPKPGDKRRIVAILDVRVGEGVPNEVSQQFQRDLDQMADPLHYFIAPRSRVHELMMNSTKWTDGCVIGPCIMEVKAQTQADVALVAAFNGSGTSFGSVITLVRTDNGHILTQESARCAVCTLNEALATAERASIKLLDALPQQLPDEEAGHHAALAAATEPLETKIASLDHTRHRVAATMVVAGLAALAAGIVVYETQSKPAYAIGITGAGAGLAVGGVVVLTF